MSRRITIDPITRLEGHGKIEIVLDQRGAVEDCFFQVPELRGFEKFAEGRPVEEMPRITSRICGVCPEAHMMASAKAGDGGIEHGELLTAFADAAVSGDLAQLSTARDALREAAGSAVVVDAAGVIGNFQRMVRIADGTGIPLDTMVETMSSDFREGLGLERFSSRRLPDSGTLARLFAPALRAIAKIGLRIAGRRARSS